MKVPTGTELASLKILKYPDARLRQSCRDVQTIDDDLLALVARMFEIMYAARGVGLAAPQVGVPLRLFVCNPASQPGQGEAVYLNPKIVQADGTVMEEEGCLSLPGVSCKVKRYKTIVLRAADLQGQNVEVTGQGLLARIFQHETDHIAGTLLADRMSVVARLANRRVLKELEDKAKGLDAT